MYDLDKTQQWLERTQQMSRRPPVRGGSPSARRDRRHATGLLACALALLAAIVLFVPMPPSHGSALKAVPVNDGPLLLPSLPEVAPPVAALSANSSALSLPAALVARAVPPPVPPPAPVWLSGIGRSAGPYVPAVWARAPSAPRGFSLTER